MRLPKESRLALFRDEGEPMALLLRGLRPRERREADRQPTPRRRRHYVLGRLAAHAAMRQLRQGAARFEVLADGSGRPRVRHRQRGVTIGMSISHSGRLAVACAWEGGCSDGLSLGIDCERIRPSDALASDWAFSPRERRILTNDGGTLSDLGIAGWCVKEATWKCLGGRQEDGPEGIEIRELDLDEPMATVAVKGWASRRLGERRMQVRLHRTTAGDGEYFVSIAECIQ